MANGLTNISGGKALSGTAQPSDVRLGMTYADGKEIREGTLDLRNLRAENIKKDVNIGGVVGALVNEDIRASAYDSGGQHNKFERELDKRSEPAREVKLNFSGSVTLGFSSRSTSGTVQIRKNGGYYSKVILTSEQRYKEITVSVKKGDVFSFEYSHAYFAPPRIKFYLLSSDGNALYSL